VRDETKTFSPAKAKLSAAKFLLRGNLGRLKTRHKPRKRNSRGGSLRSFEAKKEAKFIGEKLTDIYGSLREAKSSSFTPHP
jgi:hypothetical protein